MAKTTIPSTLLLVRARLLLGILLLAGPMSCGGPIDEVLPISLNKECEAPAGKHLSDIQSLVNWINAMPKPLTLPCFIRSLPRPLNVYAAISGESAQPSIGDNNPRLFIFLDQITLSVVPDERFATQVSGAPVDPLATKHNLLEISFNGAGISSIKGEIKFPVKEPLRNSAPYEQLAFGANASVCSLCHRGELQVGQIDGVPIYSSDRLKPTDFVGLRAMRIDYETCANPPQNYHCNMLNAIFAPGEVTWQEFPAGLPDIYYREQP